MESAGTQELELLREFRSTDVIKANRISFVIGEYSTFKSWKLLTTTSSQALGAGVTVEFLESTVHGKIRC